jgi:putative peptidoglycan lipid II flippase
MSSLKKTALIITIISLICKLFGFGREIVLAYFFGTSFIVDAYLMASSIPGILFGWITSLSVSFIPIYTDIREKQGVEKSKQFTNNILSIVFVTAIICVFIGLILNRQIVSITASGFKGEVFELTSHYLKISLWTILFIAPIQILTAYLNCNNGFIQSSISTLVVSSTQLLTIFIAGLFNNLILIYGVLISNIIHFIVVYIYSHKKNFRLKPKVEFTPEIKQALIIVVPIFISSMINQINVFVDKSFASNLNEGSIAALNYGAIMRGFIFSMFSIAITTMIYPMLSQATAEGNMTKLKDIFSKGTNITLILFIPITIGAILLAEPAIFFAFERGEFGSSSTMMTTSAFIMYSISLLAAALRDIIIKVYYSMKDTKSILIVSILTLVLNITLNSLLIGPMKHAGLALATSISEIVPIPVLFIILRKKIGALGLKNTIILFAKSCISTLAMGIVVYFGFNWLSGILGGGKLNVLLSLVLSAGVGGIIYFVLMIIFKVKEMEFFTDILKKGYRKFKFK